MRIIQVNEYQIRDFKFEDKNALVKYANNPEVSKYLRNTFPSPYTVHDAERWLKSVVGKNDSLFFAIANKNELIGGISAIPYEDIHRFTAEIGYWLGQPFWNKGITSDILKSFCNYLFNNYDFNRLTANVFEGNTASEKVLLKCGFQLEGTLKKSVFKWNIFIDQYIYGLLKENFKYDPKSS